MGDRGSRISNIPVIILLIVVVLLLFLVVALVVWGASTRGAREQIQGPNTGILPQCQSLPGKPLIEIPSNISPCTINGQPSDVYYIGRIPGVGLDMTVAPWTTPVHEVCRQYCQELSNGVCIGSNYGGRSAQVNYDECMSVLDVKTCRPPAPIARKGATLYYPYSPTCRICDFCP
jgi:hypothetical protein